MQRPFVWGKTDVVRLFSSIYQGFPIGTSLIWRTTYNNPSNLGASRAFWVPTEHQENMQAKQAQLDHGSAITLVLDGQQRLTSLNIGVRGEWRHNGDTVKLCFDANYSDGKAFKFINLDKSDLGHLIPCDQILKWEDKEYFRIILNKYFTMYGSNQNNPEHVLEKNINTLRSRFWEDEAYCYGVYQAESMEDALDVFLLANDTGKKLDKTDLVMATLQISWDTHSPREIVPALVKKLNHFFHKSMLFNQKKVLNIFFITSPSNLKATYGVAEFSAEVISELENYWTKFERVMLATVEQLKRWGLTNNGCVSSTNALIPLVRWVIINNIDFRTENLEKLEQIENARKWLISTLFSSTFGGHSPQTTAAARAIIDTADKGIFPFETLHRDLDGYHVHDLLTRQGVTRFIDDQSYMKSKLLVRLILMLIKGDMQDASFKYEIDHVFPQATYADQYPDSIHSIVNLELLTTMENGVKKHNNPAVLWNSSQFDDNWRTCNQLTSDKEVENALAIFDDPQRLWSKRRELIVDLVCNALGID
jgi:hypothetical protein